MNEIKPPVDTNLYRVGPGVLTTLTLRERDPIKYYALCYAQDLITIGEFEKIIGTFMGTEKVQAYDRGKSSEYYSDPE